MQCIPNDTIHTWKELEYKFLKRYFFNAQFVEGNTEISNFYQDESESLSDVSGMFKLLFQRSPNHNMSVMEYMTHFISRLKTSTIILLDVSISTIILLDISIGGTLKTNNKEKIKDLIENMC